MDRVRFGRVLGRGARLAAHTAWEAVDAATATPTQTPGATRRREPVVIPPPVHRAPAPLPTAGQGHLRHAARSAGQSALAPLRQASRALWHEVTGSFFALFAFSFGFAVWHMRSAAWGSSQSERHRLVAFSLLALLFAYFSLSSFLRARKRSAA